MAGGSCSSFAGLFGLKLPGSVCLRIKAGRHGFDGPPLPGLPQTLNIYVYEELHMYAEESGRDLYDISYFCFPLFMGSLIKNKIQLSSNIRKFRVEQLQSHIKRRASLVRYSAQLC